MHSFLDFGFPAGRTLAGFHRGDTEPGRRYRGTWVKLVDDRALVGAKSGPEANSRRIVENVVEPVIRPGANEVVNSCVVHPHLVEDSWSAESLRAPNGIAGPLEETGAQSAARVRTALFNVKYSPNLGDGVIAECLEYGLRRHSDRIDPFSIDIAGRTAFQSAQRLNRARVLSLIEKLPDAARALILPLLVRMIVRFRLSPRWREELKGCEMAVIGGGALLADADQNFPVKISNVLTDCSRDDIPVVISHVGVSRGWSRPGRTRFLSALKTANVVGISARDAASIANFTSEFGPGVERPRLALDPGLLASECYGRAEAEEESRLRKRVGIGITSPLVLRLHGQGSFDSATMKDWLIAVISELAKQKFDPVLFTNGSPEDEQFLDELYAEDTIAACSSRMERFREPAALSHFISTLDCVIAHRLHACIVAYSYRIPAIGLVWDPKLESFFETVSREAFVVEPTSWEPGDVAALAGRAIADPPDPAEHRRLLAQCNADVAALANIILESGKAR